jgi:metal-dependent amidase/aminoacylase/carboxypeptidase family protein
MPHASINPGVMAASTVLRLQTIVSREVGPSDAAVVTVGALQAGTKENVIPDEGVIKLNVRTFDEGVRQRVLDTIKRVVNAESEASGAPTPPAITALDRYVLAVPRPRPFGDGSTASSFRSIDHSSDSSAASDRPRMPAISGGLIPARSRPKIACSW